MPRFNPDIVRGFQDGLNNSTDKQYNIKDSEVVDVANMEYYDDKSLMTRRGVAKITSSPFASRITSVHSLIGQLIVTTDDQVYVSHTLETPDFIAVGDPPNTLMYSVDGKNWTGLGATIFTGYADAIAWNGSMWLAGGGGTNSLAYSTDGLNWTGIGTTAFTNVYGIGWSDDLNMWIACGDGPSTLASSTDGITWTDIPGIFDSFGDGANWNTTLQLWLVLGNYSAAAGFQNSYAYSANGTAWTEENSGAPKFSVYGEKAANNASIWVAVGKGATNTIMSSTNGTAWTGRGVTCFSTTGFDVCWSDEAGIFVAVGQGTNSIGYSANGTAWTGEGTATFTTNGFGVCWSPTHHRFVATGTGTNSIAYSSTGLAWTGVGNSLSASVFAVAARQ